MQPQIHPTIVEWHTFTIYTRSRRGQESEMSWVEAERDIKKKEHWEKTVNDS